MSDSKVKIEQGLRGFSSGTLADGSRQLLMALGYHSDKTADFSADPAEFVTELEEATAEKVPFPRDKAQLRRWRECAFLFQLTNDEIPALATGQTALAIETSMQRGLIESFVFIAIALEDKEWSRTELAVITRELNRRFPMPAIVLFSYGKLLSLAVIDRRINKKDSSRDVIDSRITVIKDIRCAAPHRAHIEILAGLAIENLGKRQRPTNFRELYDAWMAVLSIQELNKRFYTELAWWYFWAVKQVDFPAGGGTDAVKRNSVGVIRLLTRLIFVWFIKEKGLVPEALFDRTALRKLLKNDPTASPEQSNYYLAILQNLFFATLNVEMGTDESGNLQRRWSGEKSKTGGQSGHYLIHSVYRHKEAFIEPAAALDLFARMPFLNGGLFECLDREVTERDFQRSPELKSLVVKEGRGWVLRVDGFSRRPEAQPKVPNRLFFGGEAKADLNEDLGTKGKQYEVHGLLDIFQHYKFTVDENTPLEEEVALDPELLGKVFENLLASYNEDTKSTARKQTGSFYTPREVVDYMVDEALVAYFGRALATTNSTTTTHHGLTGKPVNFALDFGPATGELDLRIPESSTARQIDRPVTALDQRLRRLLAYADSGNPFSTAETETLIAAIEQLKLLDPACGSGAFPMGALQKLVHVLRKLDPENRRWRDRNRQPLQEQLNSAQAIADPNLREERTEAAEATLAKFDRDFSDANYPDYTRKLYLIEKCIHGVDIQPIAVQIAKLRFFIALIVSQKVDDSKANRNITALPNLETKIVAADSLTPIDRPAQMGLRDQDIDEKEKALAYASEYYFAARTGKTKRKWRERIFELRDELAVLLEKDRFLSSQAARQLVHWNPFDQNAAADFFDPEWMFQLTDGFDVVIGNPPYVRQEEIKHLKPSLKAHYDCFTGTADLYVYFYERSIKLLKPHGAFAFITSNKWYRAKYGEKLREWLNCNTRIRSIIDFGDAPVFTAIAYPTIIIVTRRAQAVKTPLQGEELFALNWAQEHPVEVFPEVFAQSAFAVPQAELSQNGWQLEPPLKRQLLARIHAAGKPLGEYVNGRLYRGILTGLNDAFVIDGDTRMKLITEDQKSADIIKPFLRGRDVRRWKVEPQDLWLIFTRRPFDIKKYPAIQAHLEQFKSELMPKPDSWDDRRDGSWTGRKSGTYEWYEIQDNIAYWQEFEHPKIFVPAITDATNYAHDTKGFYGNDKTSIIVSEQWRYLLAILNSSISWWLTQQLFASKQGGFFEFKPMYVSQIPIPTAEISLKSTLEICVNAILAQPEPRFEQLINGLVYELFFPEDLHQANIHLFTAAEQAGLGALAELEGEALKTAAAKLAETIFDPDHPIQRMLHALQNLDIVRIIEGKEGKQGAMTEGLETLADEDICLTA